MVKDIREKGKGKGKNSVVVESSGRHGFVDNGAEPG